MAQPATIRSATIEDVQAMAELHIRSWQWAYRGLIEDEYLDSLSSMLEQRVESRRRQLAVLPPETRWWVSEQAGKIVGFAITGLSRDQDVPPGTAEVYAIYLAQEAAGQGIGRALFAHAVADLRQRGFEHAILWVLSDNQRAQNRRTAWHGPSRSTLSYCPHCLKEVQRAGWAQRMLCENFSACPSQNTL